MTQTKRTILCTGGIGYIGSHTVIKLLEAGYDVHIVDNLSNSSLKVLDRIKQITDKTVKFTLADISDDIAMEKLFSTSQIDAVIHFAALKSVGESVSKPLMYYENNVGGTVKLLRTMNKYNCKTIVFSSSATVYKASVTPLTETDALGPSNPYGQTKRMMETILEDLSASDHDWKIELLRYFNPVGAHPSGLIGESPSGIPNNLVPYIQQVAVGRRTHLNVFGNDYCESQDGTGVRDYLHVEDLADAHVKAVAYLFNKEQGGCWTHNLGTGSGYSVLEMIKAFEKECGKEIKYQITARRPGDLGKVICNPSAALMDLGWKAEYGLSDMMKHAWRWQNDNPYGYEN